MNNVQDCSMPDDNSIPLKVQDLKNQDQLMHV